MTPSNNYSIYKGDSIIINVQANDPDGLIENIDFIIDNNNVYQAKIEPYKYVWHTNDAKGGQHSIKITATDNEGSHTSKMINIEIKTISPIIQTLPISFIGTTYATLKGNVTSTGIPAIYNMGVCWNTSGNPIIEDNKTILAGDTGTYIGELKELLLGTKYFVKTYARNIDTIVYGDEVSFSTYNIYYSDSGSFTDNRDSTIYKWIKIGNQIWMAENLKYLASNIQAYVPNYYDPTYPWNYTGPRYIRDIPLARASEYYQTYGCLYHDQTNLCPNGWHIPSSTEFLELINYVGGKDVAAGVMKESGTEHWDSPNTGATNKTNYTVLGAGSLNNKYNDNYTGLKTRCAFWTSDLYLVRIQYDSEGIINFGPAIYPEDTWCFYSIRCIKD